MTASLITITSNAATPETLFTPASGQARVEAIDGAFDSLLIEPDSPSFFFTEVEFNVNILSQQSGQISISVLKEDGTTITSEMFNLSNGGNFFGIQATPGHSFTSVSLSATSDDSSVPDIIQDVRQIRVTGPVAIPEPGTGVLAASVFLLMVRRRKRV